MTGPRVPLLRFDSGWLFILAGLVLCIACALASADRELQTLRVQQSLLTAEEAYAYARLRAHEDFLVQLENPDEALTRRLAAAELNLMPADEEPALRLITYELPTVEWIDHTVERPAPKPVLANQSKLMELATGQYRLWVFGAGVMCVFLGLLLDPSAASGRRRRSNEAVSASVGTCDLGATAVCDAGDAPEQPREATFESAAAELEEPDIVELAHADADMEVGAEIGADDRALDVDDMAGFASIDDQVDAVAELESEDDEDGAAHDFVEEDDAEGEAFEDEDDWDGSDEADDEAAQHAEDDADEEYELLAEDVEVIEVMEQDEDDAAHETPVDDPFAARDDVTGRSAEVISIRPSMSVAPPVEDEADVDGDLYADEHHVERAHSIRGRQPEKR